MDFRKVLTRHLEHNADITIATIPVDERQAKSFGIMQTDPDGRIRNFVEKPKDPAVLQSLAMPAEIVQQLKLGEDQPYYEASMASTSSTVRRSSPPWTMTSWISASTLSRRRSRTTRFSAIPSRLLGGHWYHPQLL